MKYIIVFSFFFLFMSCKYAGHRSTEGSVCGPKNYATFIDLRCQKFKDEASRKGKAAGACYEGPLMKGIDEEAKDPLPEACATFYKEALAKCDALPPPGPGDIKQYSGSSFYKDGNPIMVDGKPVCPD